MLIYKLHLNSWTTKYSQNVTCVVRIFYVLNTCYLNVLLPQTYFRKTDMTSMIVTRIFYVKHMLLECPITTDLFQKNGYDFNDCDNVRLRDILYNTDIYIVDCTFA